jgi:membrane protein implicated in regulation of membrane protease activity
MVVLIGLFLLALLAGGQAFTLVWLSAFPANSSRLDSLSIQFWSYAIISVALFVFDVWLLVRTIKQINRTGS